MKLKLIFGFRNHYIMFFKFVKCRYEILFVSVCFDINLSLKMYTSYNIANFTQIFQLFVLTAFTHCVTM
jgi:hypothetical protein